MKRVLLVTVLLCMASMVMAQSKKIVRQAVKSYVQQELEQRQKRIGTELADYELRAYNALTSNNVETAKDIRPDPFLFNQGVDMLGNEHIMNGFLKLQDLSGFNDTVMKAYLDSYMELKQKNEEMNRQLPNALGTPLAYDLSIEMRKNEQEMKQLVAKIQERIREHIEAVRELAEQ